MQPTRTRLAAALAGLAALAALTACSSSDGGGDSSEAGVTSADMGVADPERAAAPADGSGDRAYDSGGLADDTAALTDGLTEELADGQAGQDGQAGEPVEVGTTAVIATGTVELEAEDVGKARFDIRKLVDQFRGTVTQQETTTGDEGEVTTARLVVRVPSDRFTDAQAALEEVGTLTGSDSAAEDVTTEVLDIEARVRAQRKSVERIEALLAQAENLQQVVSIENQLARRQADLDSLVSRQKWLADQTSLSTLTVYVEKTEKEEADEEETAGGFLGGLRDGWDSFVAGGAVALTVVGFALPWVALLLLIGVPLWMVVRRRSTDRTNGPVTPPTAPTA